MDALYRELITIQSKLPDNDTDVIGWPTIVTYNEALEAAQTRTGRDLIEYMITRDCLRAHRVEPAAPVRHFCPRLLFESRLEKAIAFCESSAKNS